MSQELKILMLHGFAMNGEIFKFKTRRFQELLQSMINDFYEGKSKYILKFYFPDGPISVKSDEVEDNNFNLKAWYLDASDLDDSMPYLDNFIAENGPFLGSVGFSQGSAMLQSIQESYAFKFMIFSSGFMKFVEFQKSILTPSLVLIGEYDTVINNNKFLEFCEKFIKNKKILRHQGNHCFPNKPNTIKEMNNWILSLLREV